MKFWVCNYVVRNLVKIEPNCIGFTEILFIFLSSTYYPSVNYGLSIEITNNQG